MLINIQIVYRVAGQGIQSAYHDSVTHTFGENQDGELLVKDTNGEIIATYSQDQWLYWTVSQ